MIQGTKLGKEIAEALEEYELPIFKSFTVQRQAYARTAIDGLTVIDGDDDRAAAEVATIAQELREIAK
jgi:chromosome partitioning protein